MTKKEIWNAMSKLLGDNSVQFNDLFNCFDSNVLEELLEYLQEEYAE